MVFGIENSQISLSNFVENLLPRRVCNNVETVASKITPNFNVKENQSSRWVTSGPNFKPWVSCVELVIFMSTPC